MTTTTRGPGGPSRNMMHGNRVNKRGQCSKRAAQSTRSKDYSRPSSASHESKASKMTKDKGDTVIHAPPPKPTIQLATDELRFTLPNTPTNCDIRIQQIKRASATSAVLMRELENELKCRSGTQSDRVQVLGADTDMATEDSSASAKRPGFWFW